MIRERGLPSARLIPPAPGWAHGLRAGAEVRAVPDAQRRRPRPGAPPRRGGRGQRTGPRQHPGPSLPGPPRRRLDAARGHRRAERERRVALNVANLPLRPPVVLAKSIATLDLGDRRTRRPRPGAGSFWDAIVAAGGARFTPARASTPSARASRSSAASGAPTDRRCGSTVTTTGSPDSTQGPRPRTPSRSGSARTNPDAETHRPVCGRLAPEHGLRPARGTARHERDHRRGGPGRRPRPGGGAPSLQRLRVVRPDPRPRALGHGRGLGRAAGGAHPRPRA